ncbi:MAG: hypothetical protein AB8B69_21460 [Chitinophagales bacterium]
MQLNFTFLILLFLCVFSSNAVIAQPNTPNSEESEPAVVEGEEEEEKIEPRYSFVSENRYKTIHELDDQYFFPAKYQLGQKEIVPIDAGQMMVSIQTGMIIIRGVENLGTFHITQKEKERVGYVYELMNKAGQTARFKVVLDQDSYINLLYFYSRALGEHTFFLAEKEDQALAAEQNFFTPKSKFFVRHYGNLLKKEVKPFSVIKDLTLSEIEERVAMESPMTISFTEFNCSTPQGTFSIKEAKTYEYRSAEFPSVRSRIELFVKEKPKRVFIYLSFKQEIECIEIGDTRYFLMP